MIIDINFDGHLLDERSRIWYNRSFGCAKKSAIMIMPNHYCKNTRIVVCEELEMVL
jgi:hypothetical protein